MILQLYDGSTSDSTFPVLANFPNGGGLQFVLSATAGHFSILPPPLWTLSFSARLDLYKSDGTRLCGVEFSGDISLVLATKTITVNSFSHINIGTRPVLSETKNAGSGTDAAIFKTEIKTAFNPPTGQITSFGGTAFSDVFIGLVPDNSYIVRSNSTISHNVQFGDIVAGSRMAFPPIAAFTTEADELNVDFDGNNSKVSHGLDDPDPDNHLVSYDWAFGDGATGTGVETEHDYLDDGIYSSVLKVTDIYGGFGTTTHPITLNGATRCGVIVDAPNTMTTAVGQGGGVAINRFTAGASSKLQVATLANARYPTLFQNGARAESDRCYIVVRNRSSAQWEIMTSDNKGESWSDAVSVPFDNTYRAATACGTIEGILIAVGIKAGSGEIYSRRSYNDGETWDAPVMVFPTSTNRFVQVTQLSSPGGSRLVVTDGNTFFRFSDNLGETWGAS